jgi:hypothetical protein
LKLSTGIYWAILGFSGFLSLIWAEDKKSLPDPVSFEILQQFKERYDTGRLSSQDIQTLQQIVARDRQKKRLEKRKKRFEHRQFCKKKECHKIESYLKTTCPYWNCTNDELAAITRYYDKLHYPGFLHFCQEINCIENDNKFQQYVPEHPGEDTYTPDGLYPELGNNVWKCPGTLCPDPYADDGEMDDN